MATSSTMRALAVTDWTQPPALTTTATPSPPSPGQTQVRVLAAGLAQLVRSQATGKHYSTSKASLPYIPGVEGVGLTVPDNTLVYFNTMSNPAGPGGAFTELVNVDSRAIFPVPTTTSTSTTSQTSTATKLAALMNPAMSSYMALHHRAHISTLPTSRPLTILILGATSVSGHLAALTARHLGFTNIIGAARPSSTLTSLQASNILTHTIPIDSTDPSKTDFSLLQTLHPDVILDYIYGPLAAHLFASLPASARDAEDLEIRYVHIGALSGVLEIPLPAAMLRSKNVSVSGSGPGAWSLRQLKEATPGIMEVIEKVVPDESGWREEYGVVERGLDQVGEAWADKKGRTVFVV